MSTRKAQDVFHARNNVFKDVFEVITARYAQIPYVQNALDLLMTTSVSTALPMPLKNSGSASVTKSTSLSSIFVVQECALTLVLIVQFQ